jgi:hypothetical protein
MSRFPHSRYATALALVRSTPPSPATDLDDTIELACDGDRAALGVVAEELRDRLVMQVIAVRGERFENEADDVVDDLFLAMLDPRVPFARCRVGALPNLLFMAEIFARRHLEQASERWNVDVDERRGAPEGSPTARSRKETP